MKTCTICSAVLPEKRRLYCSSKCSRRSEKLAFKASQKTKGLSLRGHQFEDTFSLEPKQCEVCQGMLPTPHLLHQKFCSKRCRGRSEGRRDRAKIWANPSSKARENLHNRLSEMIRRRGQQKCNALYKYLGCSGSELIEYIESQWQAGMTWENWSSTSWNIDHIIPYSYFDLTKEDHRHVCCHYLNLRPVWASENIKKGDRLDLSLVPEPLKEKAEHLSILDRKPYLERIRQ